MSSVFLFSGQLNRTLRLTKKTYELKSVQLLFEYANSVFKKDLMKLCIEGASKEEICRPSVFQPMLFLLSISAIEKLKYKNLTDLENCIATAGFDIGEYTSLVFSGSLKFEDALRLIKKRIEYIEHIKRPCSTQLILVEFIKHVISGGQKKDLQRLIEDTLKYCNKQYPNKTNYIDVAHLVAPQLRTIGVSCDAMEFIKENYAKYGIESVKQLDIHLAINTKFMLQENNSFPLNEILENSIVNTPLICTYSNYDGEQYKSSENIRFNLNKQIYSVIKWEHCLKNIFNILNYETKIYFNFSDDILKSSVRKRFLGFNNFKCLSL